VLVAGVGRALWLTYPGDVNAMVWWLIPLAATVLAVAWVSWVNRPRPPADPHETLRDHERFKQAMERGTRGDEGHPQAGGGTESSDGGGGSRSGPPSADASDDPGSSDRRGGV
jgi:hypothetical protein